MRYVGLILVLFGAMALAPEGASLAGGGAGGPVAQNPADGSEPRSRALVAGIAVTSGLLMLVSGGGRREESV